MRSFPHSALSVRVGLALCVCVCVCVCVYMHRHRHLACVNLSVYLITGHAYVLVLMCVHMTPACFPYIHVGSAGPCASLH